MVIADSKGNIFGSGEVSVNGIRGIIFDVDEDGVVGGVFGKGTGASFGIGEGNIPGLGEGSVFGVGVEGEILA